MSRVRDNRTCRIERLARRAEALMVPRPLPNEPGLVMVDATWGAISPIQLAPGVRTVGELEVIDHIHAALPLVDTRLESFYREGSIPGARNVVHERMEESIGSLDPNLATIFFCNGPQCAATPAAINTLLGAGYPAETIIFYRGGIHDWMTLGLPVEIPA
jgi:rhodanese-related sulfurtransferase